MKEGSVCGEISLNCSDGDDGIIIPVLFIKSLPCTRHGTKCSIYRVLFKNNTYATLMTMVYKVPRPLLPYFIIL